MNNEQAGPSEEGEGMERFRVDPSTGKSLRRWADAQQFHQEPMPKSAENGPSVVLLNATPDPLGTLAAITALYSGKVIRDLSEVSHEDRRKALADMQATALNSALESVNFVFLFEGVNRSFTHQMVRGRHAMYVQESLRFAVPEDWAAGIPLPPSLAGMKEDDPRVRQWKRALNNAEDSYASLVSSGVPAEEARDLLPHAVRTRIHWVVSLRELLNVAGLRTCTQAQFVWRQVFSQVATALREYGARQSSFEREMLPPNEGRTATVSDRWQFDLIADHIRPVCYLTGKCAFKASFDRACSIRDRVDANEKAGRPSSEWNRPRHCDDPLRCLYPAEDHLHPILPHEWAADPSAARLREENR